MYPGSQVLHKLLLFYGSRTPYHRGKGRIVESLIRLFRLDDYYRGRSFNVSRHNLDWQLHPDCLVQRALYYLSYYEVKETKWIQKQVRPDWVFFDVGSNFGYYSLLVSEFSGRKAQVYAFEPLANNYELLNLNKKLNSLEYLNTFKLALSDRIGEVEFIVPSSSNLGHGRIANDAVKNLGTTERVQTSTLDEFVKQNQVAKIDFIKVDIEGAETAFLKGAKRTLQDFKPMMMIECNPSSLIEFGTSAETMLNMLHELKYDTLTVGRSGLRKFSDVNEVDDYCNVICLPKG